jgi:hypothetical protein
MIKQIFYLIFGLIIIAGIISSIMYSAIILIMIPIFCISIVFAIIWNILLILDLIIGDISRKGKKEIQQINREEHK